MPEEMVVQYCAPTLAGIKTGNLFRCYYDTEEDARLEISSLNKRLFPKGLCLLPLSFRNGWVLLYLYRPKLLLQDLSDTRIKELLKAEGYTVDSCKGCGGCGRTVAELMKKVKMAEDFPHEIGLFLSYPPEDVQGFIENKAENYKCSGVWKVYGDEEKAAELFSKYRLCTEVYRKSYERGFRLEQLAVAG